MVPHDEMGNELVDVILAGLWNQLDIKLSISMHKFWDVKLICTANGVY